MSDLDLLTAADACYLVTLVEPKSRLWCKLQAIAENRAAVLPTGDFGIEISPDGRKMMIRPTPAIYVRRGDDWERQ